MEQDEEEDKDSLLGRKEDLDELDSANTHGTGSRKG
jgi:hypothetical protein